ncbi:hypothetical protein ACFOU2_22670 [Bacillus songklensis]|uniref:Uncharacterized protein n=1 Tax=Bacillus songklensis TaxID=1069116 RepID=A0ABV8B9G2_9BACI
MNNKAENFKRLAEKRVTECVKKIRLIGNLANKNNYEYTNDQAKKIITTLENEVKLLRNRFKEESESIDYTFRFDDE